jgi:hypothetical protein
MRVMGLHRYIIGFSGVNFGVAGGCGIEFVDDFSEEADFLAELVKLAIIVVRAKHVVVRISRVGIGVGMRMRAAGVRVRGGEGEGRREEEQDGECSGEQLHHVWDRVGE